MITRWEELEEAVRTELVRAQEIRPIAWHRLVDTKAAGNIVARQPSDFIACMGGKATLIEAKFSEAHDSLRSCFSDAVKAHQLASARIWTRAGADYIILFYSSLSGITEVWSGLYAAECRSRGKRLALDERKLYSSVEAALKKEIGYA